MNSSNMKVKIGILTIGQSPRDDIMKDISEIFSSKFEILERGALDPYDYDTVQSEFYPENDDMVLVSRMRDGKQVKISEEKIIKLLQNSIDYLEEKQCQVILMMCTGRFPQFNHKTLLLRPQEMLHGIAEKISDGNRIGVIVPDKEQVEMIKLWWNEQGVDIEVEVASPYLEGSSIRVAAASFLDKDIAFIFMDCMGYSNEMKNVVREISGKPVLLPRTLAARVIEEMF